MEDARFVRFTGDDGAVTYYATYTAFDGVHVAPQLLETDDFRHFRVTQLSGPAAKNKGLAAVPPPGRRALPRPVALGPGTQLPGRFDRLPVVGRGRHTRVTRTTVGTPPAR